MFLKIIKIAIRSILNFRTYSGINLLGLALSLACVITIFRYVYGEFTVDRFNKNIDRMYVTTRDISTNPGYIYYEGIKSSNWREKTFNDPTEHPGVELFSQFILYGDRKEEIELDNRKYDARILVADSNFLKIMDYPVVFGVDKLSEPHSALITKSYAKKLFGNQDPVGKTFLHASGDELTITGIIGQASTKTMLAFDVVISYHLTNNWTSIPQTLLLLYPGVDYNNINNQYASYFDNWGGQMRYQLFPFSMIYFDKSIIDRSTFKQGNYNYVRVLMAVGLLILLAGLINYINIYTVAVLRRGRELGVKKVFGAGGNYIFLQLTVENLFITGLALIIAFILTNAVQPFVSNVLLLEQVPNIRFDAFLSGALLLLLPTLTTLYPFFRHHYASPVNSMRNLDKIRGGNVRRVFLSFQYIITIVLIIVSLFFVKQLRFMLNTDPGFRTKDIIKVSFQKFQSFHKPLFISAQNYVKNADGSITITGRDENMEAWEAKQAHERATAEEITQKINASPLFTNWTLCSSPNKFTVSTSRFKYLDGEYKEINLERASDIWFKLFDIQLIEGQFWDETMEFGEMSLIVTESILKLFGITDFTNAMLQRDVITYGGQKDNTPFRIVGVVKDMNYLHLSQKSEPVAFLFDKESIIYSDVEVAIVPGRTREAIDFLRKLHDETVGGEFTYSFLEDEINEMYREDKKIASIYAVFTLFAIFVSILGLFSMSLFDIQQRRKEIAIRKINGATITDIIRLLLKKYFWSLSISFVIASPVALFAINRYLEDFANKASVSWWLFAVAIALTAGVSLLTLISQTQKAANQNPAEAIVS